ncbi:endonuclease III domain-containing protein [Acidithiobacillus sp.]|uniref:endonuclease III domain-containing protein n=1 Tax=Acidithiobacillus sp. TaxID=1872118 RepID=UPI003D04B726
MAASSVTRWPLVYARLHAHFGAQDWWPAQSPFEVMVGAILTQNTAWRNVERAIAALRAADALAVRAILGMDEAELAQLIRPAGYFRVKAKRLRALCAFLAARGVAEDPGQLGRGQDPAALRRDLLAVHGVGEETADAILLYALDAAVLVVDAYTRRIGERLGLLPEKASYGEIQSAIAAEIPADLAVLNELHALLVQLGKEHCRPHPRCEPCPLRSLCPHACA